MHSSYFRKHQKAQIVATGSRLLVVNLFVVGTLAIGVAGFIFDIVLGRVAGFVAAGVGLLMVFVLWLVIPWRHQFERKS